MVRPKPQERQGYYVASTGLSNLIGFRYRANPKTGTDPIFPQFQLQISEVIMRARNYMQQIAGGTGNVLTHHKTIEDLQRYFGDNSSKPDVQEFMKKITADKEG